MSASSSTQRLLSILQWAGRLCGLALFLLVLAIAIGDGGPPNPLRQPLPVFVQLVLLLVMVMGLIVAWRWEAAGALATLAALVAFEMVNLAASGKLAGGAFPLFAIPPVLYLAHAAISERVSRTASISGNAA